MLTPYPSVDLTDPRPIVHLICTAHIDPIWMWTWEEGLREALSTFHAAARLLDEFPEFVFNHNESLLYQWVEEYDPPLFARIQALVRAGRWHIAGGWYLQPDLNLPQGETLARVILEGRRYFAEKFGVRPRVAYNFDSFGHPASLPQLLQQSGFEMYIHCRPVDSQMALPAPFYRWQGIDGSEVIGVRPDTGWYGTPHPGQALEQARKGLAVARKTRRDTIVTWGLGDHGGGATRHDLFALRDLIAETIAAGDVVLAHSTPEAFLERLRPYRELLPVVRGDLQRTLSGTYTSVATIKRQMRSGETWLDSAERWSAAAWWRAGLAYPSPALREAWRALMLNTFHDVLCGSLVESAIDGVNDLFGQARNTARRVVVKAQHALLPNVTPQPDTIPIYVFNPHGSALQMPVGLNFMSAYAPPPTQAPYTLYDDSGAPVPSQNRGGDSILLDESTWQPFCGFVADMPPMSARRYEIRWESPAPQPERLTVHEDAQSLTLETPFWSATFDRASGALNALTDKASGRAVLDGALRLMAMHDYSHAWGGENNWVFNRPFAPLTALTPEQVGDFVGMEGHSGPAVRVIARGDVWVTVECLVGWQHTRASVRHTFYGDLPFIDIDTRLYMQARRKMIKLQIPLALKAAKVTSEIPYGSTVYPADATEYPGTRWLRLDSDGWGVGVANSGTGGFDASADGLVNISVTRGGTHCAWSEADVPTDKSYTFMDQTQIDTRFRIVCGTSEALKAGLPLDAAALNQPFTTFFAYDTATLPADAPVSPRPFVTVTPAHVALTALKQSEDGQALIVRVQESAGLAAHAQITLEENAPHTVSLAPHQIRSFRVTRQGAGLDWQACNLLEEPLDNTPNGQNIV